MRRLIVLTALCAALMLMPHGGACGETLPQLEPTPTPTAEPAQPECEHVYDVWNDYVQQTVPLEDDPYLCYMTMTIARRVCVFCGGYDYDVKWELHPHLVGAVCPTCRHGFATPFQIMPMPIEPEA